MESLRVLRHDEPLAIELTAILKQGDVGQLAQLLAADPGLARSVVEDAKGGRRSPLHLFRGDILAWLAGEGAIGGDRAPGAVK